MTQVASFLEEEGYTLRSGGARGADTFFENGVKDPANKDIYIVRKGYHGHSSELYGVCDRALAIAEAIHPAWDAPSMRLGDGRLLHARNVYQVLGKTFDIKSKFLLCWTPGGQYKGGTRTAIKLAESHEIPVLNFGAVKSGKFMDAFELFYMRMV